MSNLQLRHIDPRSLLANPLNWRTHSEEQIRTAEALIFGRDGKPAEVGWADVPLLNETTGRLIDGHMRVALAVRRNERLVPVLVGRWTEEQERKILATRDALGMMAEADPAAMQALHDSLSIESEAVNSLLGALRAAADLLPEDTNREPAVDAGGEATQAGAGVSGDEPEAPAREAVPDALWPSDNPYDVPTLDIGLAADAVDYPVTTWGSIGHSRPMRGTYHFYTRDARFDPLWSNPSRVLLSGCPSVVEPNFSTTDQTPLAVSLWAIFRKRWMARYWQSKGLRVFVDINVHSALLEPSEALGGRRLALLGVPAGWPAYATRAHNNSPHFLDREYAAAAAHSGLERIPLFLVIGGGQQVKQLAGERGWVWIPESSETARTPKGDS